MKYKLLGLTAMILVLLCVLPATFAMQEEDIVRYHQHLAATEPEPCSHSEDVFCTHLPLLCIDTGGQEIPGRAVQDAQGKITGFTTTATGEDRIACRLSVSDEAGRNHHPDDEPDLESGAIIHVRGNTSRTYDKPSYSIRLVNADGSSSAQPMMGMNAHHEWMLHGPILDKTCLRNYMWYNIAGEIMDYAPNVRFCEVLLNGSYEGIYVMTETITEGQDRTRLNLSVDKKENTFAGYLLRLDLGSRVPVKNIDTFGTYTYRTRNRMNIEYPGASRLTPELAEKIRQNFSQFEKTLYSFDFNDPREGYRQYVDLDSFVDYAILNEFTCNYDAGWMSTYIYRDVTRRLRMCVWDFNSCCDNYQFPKLEPQHFEIQSCLWFNMMFKDKYFVSRLEERYGELRQTFLKEEVLLQYVNDTAAYLGDALDRNAVRWERSFSPEKDLLEPAERNPRTWQAAVEQMKEFIRQRGRWMDENIGSLQQYCEESKVKKFIHNAN